MFPLVKKKKKNPISLKNFQKRHNKVLIKRRAGGFGDILMQRMMFEDFQKTFPNSEIYFTCPMPFLEMAKNHPYAKTIDISKIKEEEYGIVYDITTACRVYETKHGENNKEHRSDIWAAHCGVTLKNHNMHLKPTKEMTEICHNVLLQLNPNKKPILLLCTQSTNDEFGISKSLTENLTGNLIQNLQKDFFICTIHNEKQHIYELLNIQQFTCIQPQAWIALVDLVDYVITVDTATFHLAGGLKKPCLGIFTFTNGSVYGKYYKQSRILQSFCPFQYKNGCFNAFLCPQKKISQSEIIPCKKNINTNDILSEFYELLKPRMKLEVVQE